MSIAILGKGWITNQGCDEAAVSKRILKREGPQISEIENPFTGRIHHVAVTSPEDYAEAESFRRVRRSSIITFLALTAAIRAIRDSGIQWNEATARRTVLLFVSTDGGVLYTRRFYTDIVKSGAGGASPILFPETVYNAPASHLCAYFGIEGDALTLVGDAGIVGGALHRAEEILAAEDADYCLIVGAEEMDWILCEAYSTWKQTRDSRKERTDGLTGAYFAEGAGAVLLAREGSPLLCKTHPGFSFQHAGEAGKRFDETCEEISTGSTIRFFVSSGNKTEVDEIESECIRRRFSDVPVYRVKDTLGEALAASSLHQMIFAAHLMKQRNFPGGSALISTLGFNSLAGAALLTLDKPQG